MSSSNQAGSVLLGTYRLEYPSRGHIHIRDIVQSLQAHIDHILKVSPTGDVASFKECLAIVLCYQLVALGCEF